MMRRRRPMKAFILMSHKALEYLPTCQYALALAHSGGPEGGWPQIIKHRPQVDGDYIVAGKIRCMTHPPP